MLLKVYGLYLTVEAKMVHKVLQAHYYIDWLE